MLKKYPALYLLVTIILGIVISDFTRIPGWLFLLAGFILSLLGFVYFQKKKTTAAIFLFGFSFLSLSGFNFANAYYNTGLNHISNFTDADTRYHIFATVSDWPKIKTNRTEIKIEIDSLISDNRYYPRGGILIKLSDTTASIQRGDNLEFYARIYPVRETSSEKSFDYNRYLNLKNIFGVAYLTTLLDVRIDKGNRYGIFKVVDQVRDYIRNIFYKNLSTNSAGLAAGFLIGETKDISPELYQKFRTSGTLHLLAVSGSNVALVVLFFIFVLRPFPLPGKMRSFLLLFVIIIFNFLSYGEPSVLRASVMATLVILAGIIERRIDLNNIIAVAAVAILIWEPSQLYDVGFQLSFVITWGLIYSLPPLTNLFDKYKNRIWYRWLVFPLMVAVIAQLFSAGIIVLYFNTLPLISPVANLFVVPLVSIAVFGLLILIVANLIHPVLAVMFGSWLNLILEFTTKLVVFFADETIPKFEPGHIPGYIVLIFYLLLVMGIWSITNRKIRKVTVFIFLIFTNGLIVHGIIAKEINSSGYRLHCFSIPGGVVSLIRYGDEPNADVIISGMSDKNYSITEKIINPYFDKLEIDKVDNIFVLASDYNSLSEIVDLVKKYRIEMICLDRSLIKSFEDQISNVDTPEYRFTVKSLNESSQPVSQNGYYIRNNSLLFKYDNLEIIISNQPDENTLSPYENFPEKILIIGNQWKFDWRNYITRKDISHIICSNIEQEELERLNISKAGQSAEAKPILLSLYEYDIYSLNLSLTSNIQD